jgi:hypothetical protein
MAKGKKKRRIPEPEPTAKAAPRKPACACRARGCLSLALARHEGPDGEVIWLCTEHDRIARENLAGEQAHQELLDELAKPLERLATFRAKQNARRVA